MPKRIILLIFLSVFLPVALFLLRQRTNTLNLATNSDQIITLNFTQPIYQFSISGRVDLHHQDLSFLRIILVDNQNNEYLVYETSLLLTDQKSFFITNQCDETCLLDGVIPKQLRIEGYQYSFLLANYSASSNLPKTVPNKDINLQRQQIKKEKDSLKISQLNKQIKQRQLSWIAGETSVSKLTYAQKKELFSTPDGKPLDKLPNLQGFEYYKGGIFKIRTGDNSTPTPPVPSNLPLSWDWRNVHGENWNTPVRSQHFGNCWAFAEIGAMESQINLYFNQHLNIDLSEQMLSDCSLNTRLPLGMHYESYPNCSSATMIPYCSGVDYCVIGEHGIPDENCDNGVDIPENCNENFVCSDWQSRVWKVTDFYDYYEYKIGERHSSSLFCPKFTLINEDTLKSALIQKGPLSSSLDSWWHAMVLEGYEENPSGNGNTVWIFKNSWGENWGEGGYAKIETNLEDMDAWKLPLGPFIPPPNSSFWPAGFNNQIKCHDNDGDSYCNWGISDTKPSTCPVRCKPQKDCNDSNPAIGPFDDNQGCLAITPTPTRYPKPPKNLPTLPPGGVWR